MHIMLKIPVVKGGGRVLPNTGVIYGLNRYEPLKRVFASPILEQSKKNHFLERGIFHFILALNQAYGRWGLFITETVTGTRFLFILEKRYRKNLTKL